MSQTLPKDVGLCPQCSAPNSRLASRCNACSAALPWAKTKTQANAPAARVAVKTRANNSDVAESLTSFGGHAATFLFCAAVPLLGFFLWKYMNNEDSRFTMTALFGWTLGIVFHVIRFAWRFF